jgi:enterochelin esterase-like enzyme
LAVDSRVLGRRKDCLIYRPAEEAVGQDAPPVVLLLQGNEEWQETAYFDNLIAAGQVPPFVAVLFRERSFTVRLREFSGGPAHGRFVTDELWPLLDRRGLLSGRPAAVAGFSAGGLAAAALATDEPDLFPRLAVVSGALHLTPVTDLNRVSDGSSWLLRWLEHAPAVPERAYVSVGRFEDAWEEALYANAVELADVLRRHGATVRFDTGPTGHDGISARAYLGAGLSWLLADG